LNLEPESESAALLAVRQSLAGIVQRWELDDPVIGVVGIVPVVGGVFIHPLTHEPIPYLRIYGASAGCVKITEPRFLRSLTLVSVAGLTNPTQFCALVVKLLSERLKELARVREYAAAVGVRLDLEHDNLRLRGRFKLQGLEIELLASNTGMVTVIALSTHSLAGVIARNDRSLMLSGDPTTDHEALARLISTIEERVYAALTPTNDTAMAVQPLGTDNEPASSSDAVSIQVSLPALDPFSSGVNTGEIVELIEALEPITESETGRSLGVQQRAEGYAPIPLRELLDKLGTDTKVSAVNGRLHLEFSLKVIQGVYTFYLDQQGPKQFAGFLVTQHGKRHPIEVDLNGIMDVKEVFDRVVLGRTI
jgi:hypothetical protein